LPCEAACARMVVKSAATKCPETLDEARVTVACKWSGGALCIGDEDKKVRVSSVSMAGQSVRDGD